MTQNNTCTRQRSQAKRIIFGLCLSFVVGFAWAGGFDSVTLNGVASGRAVLTIDGRYVVMRQGDTKQGYTLISVSPNGALVAYKGQRKRLSMSVVSQLSNQLSGQLSKQSNRSPQSGVPAITNAHPLASQGTQINQANSHIISVVPVLREEDKTTFRVAYFYNGNYGEHAQLRARTRLKGQDTRFSAHSYVSLEEGRNQVDITVMMNHNAPDTFYSDEVFFDVLGSEPVANSYLVLSKSVPFARRWQRPSKKEPDFVLSNTTQWQTGTR